MGKHRLLGKRHVVMFSPTTAGKRVVATHAIRESVAKMRTSCRLSRSVASNAGMRLVASRSVDKGRVASGVGKDLATRTNGGKGLNARFFFGQCLVSPRIRIVKGLASARNRIVKGLVSARTRIVKGLASARNRIVKGLVSARTRIVKSLLTSRTRIGKVLALTG